MALKCTIFDAPSPFGDGLIGDVRATETRRYSTFCACSRNFSSSALPSMTRPATPAS
jgi:hypothetical protein